MTGPSLDIIIGANLDKLHAEMQKANGMVQGFSDKLIEMGTTMVAAFSVERIGEVVLELGKLGGQFTGVQNAFSQLGESARVLNEMKMATEGTVSEFDLMKSAVQANNFSIPIEQMGKLLEFAHQRAVATGQSVDYLVDSIVLGIGRKSPLILDNLGISAVQLKEKLHGVGMESASVGDVSKAVGEIAEESLNKMGVAIENNAVKLERLNATWENAKVIVGSSGFFSELFGRLTDSGTNLIRIFTGQKDAIQELEKVMMNGKDPAQLTIEKFQEISKKAQELGLNLNKLTVKDWPAFNQALNDFRATQARLNGISLGPDPFKLFDPTSIKKEIIDLETIAGIEARIKELREQQLIAHGAEIHAIELQIKALEKKEKLLKDGSSGFKAGDYSSQIKVVMSLAEAMNKLAIAAQYADVKNQTLQKTLERINTVSKNTSKSFALLDDWIKKNKDEVEKHTEAEKKALKEKILLMGQIGLEIGNQMGLVMAGQQSIAQAMASTTSQLLSQYAMRMIMQAGEGQAAIGGPFAVGAAAAAMAAMSALIGSYGISTHGGGGGGGSAGTINRSADNSNRANFNTPNLSINLGGNFKLQGNTLRAAIRKSSYNAGKTGG